MKKADIKAVKPLAFSWNNGKRLESLWTTYSAISLKIAEALEWYRAARADKRRLGSWTRYSGILLGVVAAAIPTLSEMALKTSPTLEWWQRPGIATILGVVAGGLFMLDRFSGGTSGWLRYTIAETALKEIQDEFTFTFALEEGQWPEQDEPSVEQTKHALVTLQGFLTRVNQIVRIETDQWKAEFQSTLQQTDEFIRTQPKKTDEAVGTIKILNPERLAGQWFVSFNDGPEQEGSDDSKTFHLTPGGVTVRLRAMIKANPEGSQTRWFKTEFGVTLVTGAPNITTVTLPA